MVVGSLGGLGCPPSELEVKLKLAMRKRDITVQIGDFDKLQESNLREWREKTHQERLDAFVELMRIWHPHAPRLDRTFTITTVPRR